MPGVILHPGSVLTHSRLVGSKRDVKREGEKGDGVVKKRRGDRGKGGGYEEGKGEGEEVKRMMGDGKWEDKMEEGRKRAEEKEKWEEVRKKRESGKSEKGREQARAALKQAERTAESVGRETEIGQLE